MAETAPSLVHFLCPDGDDRLVTDYFLGPGSGLAANDADGLELSNAFGDGQKFRHGSERLTAKIHVEARTDHAHSAVSELITDVDDRVVEELNFIDADNPRIIFHSVEDLTCVSHGNGKDAIRIVRLDVIFAVTIIDFRFENLNFLATVLSALDAPHEFFRLPAKHTSADDLD